MRKLLGVMVFVLFGTSSAFAQDGLFLRFSLGPGFFHEGESIQGSGFSLPTKNHALGYAINSDLAFYISDFGALMKQEVGEYDYINLDALGLGVRYRLMDSWHGSFSIAHGTVSLAKDWTEATGKNDGSGIALNASLDKRWQIGKRWIAGLGPQALLFKTPDYQFVDASLNFFIEFYLSPIE